MKLASRKAASVGAQRRMQMQTARANAPAVRERFPHLARLSVELRFDERNGRPPSPQQHTLFPAARAFFRFACPCAECDGDFDLTAAVAALAESPRTGAHPARAAASGELQCEGWRARDRAGSRPCTIGLQYCLRVGEPEAAEASSP
ncbi:MAG: hypothetical protein U1F30_06380 [Steroidobacteraceae bacterium]